MSPRVPNPEQLQAIEHNGGVILKAGAGSGKTYVLVEHIIYLIKNWMSEVTLNQQELYLKKKLSQTVLMTFTNKASGEMLIRLYQRVQEQILITDGQEKSIWKMVYQNLPYLTVSTIDGFCRKLLTQGFFPDIPPHLDIISEKERTEAIRDHFDRWLITAKFDKEILETTLLYKEDIIESFSSIYGFPETRLAWEKASVDTIDPKHISDWLMRSLNQEGLTTFPSEVMSFINQNRSEEPKGFEKIITELVKLNLAEVTQYNHFKIIGDYLQNTRMAGPKNKEDPVAADLYQKLRSFKEWSNLWMENLPDYVDHFQQKVLPWFNVYLDFYQYLGQMLDLSHGMTFADLEFHVLKQLQNNEQLKKVQAHYQYFVVDEFQDTSITQFDIISHLTGGDFNKLFVVGDSKQAIYGFRGGELNVFRDCEKKMPQRLELVANYRSASLIIDFNNHFFDFLLNTTEEFKPEKNQILDISHQKYPGKESGGEIWVVEPDLGPLDSEHKYTVAEFDIVEAQSIFLSLIKEKDESARRQVILYRKLGPSQHLIGRLLSSKVGFTSQFKFALSDEPVIGICSLFLKSLMSVDEQKYLIWLNFYFKHLTHFMHLRERSISSEFFKQWKDDVQFWGLSIALTKLLVRLGFANENIDLNLGWIKLLEVLHQSHLEQVTFEISTQADETISLNISYGPESNLIQIMTAHASKGLEFPVVYLAGIYTNGRSVTQKGHVGKEVGSFKWPVDQTQKKILQTPLYLIESELERQKNISESKRLFYVACTRAENSLRWVKLPMKDMKHTLPKESWIFGIESFLAQDTDWRKRISKMRLDLTQFKIMESSSSRPLFHYTSLGLYDYQEQKESELMILPELSVTKIATLIDCPRKFFLEHTIKIPVGKKENFSIDLETDTENEEEFNEIQILSSSQRGSLLHLALCQAINHNFIIPLEHFNSPDRKKIQWALDLAKLLASTHDLHAEEALKFHFFSGMISGIPDLFAIPKDLPLAAEIWDYKTGQLNDQKLQRYWLQLEIYAWALYQFYPHQQNNQVILKIIALDHQQVYEKTVNYLDLQQKLSQIWILTQKPQLMNTSHCSTCPYNEICST